MTPGLPVPDGWTIARANATRLDALAAFGFTERQARFLLQVLLHSGVFVERQYCRFAGITHGQKTTDFLGKLVERRFATPVATGALHRGRLFHVHYKPLWAAIEEPDSRFRKPAALGRLIERVMILDAVLADSSVVWLGPAVDKVRFFASERNEAGRFPADRYPHIVFGGGIKKATRFFPDKLPIGAHPSGSPHVLLYLVTKPSPLDFRAFLLRHADLLAALYQWTIRVLVPRPLARSAPAYLRAARDHLTAKLSPSEANELAWYFRERQRLAAASAGSSERRFREAARAFAAPRFAALHRAWLEEGDSVIWLAQCTTLAEAVSRGEGRVETVALTHQYLHLSSLVGVA